MNGLDLIIIIILIGSFIRGFQLGLIRQLIKLLGFFIAIFMAYRFSGELAPYLQEYIPAFEFKETSLFYFSQVFNLQNMFYNAIAFFLIFIITKFILQIGGSILNQIANLPVLATVNRLSGALIGLLQAILIVVIIIHVISVMPWQEMQIYVEGSSISEYLMKLTPILTTELYNLWNTSNFL